MELILSKCLFYTAIVCMTLGDVALSERCFDYYDCAITSCRDHLRPVCESDVCSCRSVIKCPHSGAVCNFSHECLSFARDCSCDTHQIHCIDQHCHCGFNVTAFS